MKNHELKVLNVLAFAEPMSLSELSRRAHLDRGWVSRLVASLAKKELVSKWDDPGNHRSVLVGLTLKGIGLVREMLPTMLAREAILLRGLDADLVHWILDTLLDRLEILKNTDAE